jgi:hypothetical protein
MVGVIVRQGSGSARQAKGMELLRSRTTVGRGGGDLREVEVEDTPRVRDTMQEGGTHTTDHVVGGSSPLIRSHPC